MYSSPTVALPLKGNEFQANHNQVDFEDPSAFTVALPLKGNEFQANHNREGLRLLRRETVALPLKGNEFQANHNLAKIAPGITQLLLYLSKVTTFKQITTQHRGE